MTAISQPPGDPRVDVGTVLGHRIDIVGRGRSTSASVLRLEKRGLDRYSQAFYSFIYSAIQKKRNIYQTHPVFQKISSVLDTVCGSV